MCVCVCVYMFMYVHIYTHTHTLGRGCVDFSRVHSLHHELRHRLTQTKKQSPNIDARANNTLHT